MRFDSRDSRNPETARFLYDASKSSGNCLNFIEEINRHREISLAIAETILRRTRKRCKTFDRTTFLRTTICIHFRRNVSVNIYLKKYGKWCEFYSTIYNRKWSKIHLFYQRKQWLVKSWLRVIFMLNIFQKNEITKFRCLYIARK